MKKISLLKNTLFWEAPYAFKEPGETKYKSKYASNGSTFTPIFKKFDKTRIKSKKEKCYIKSPDI
jgi:hypothetical protein